MPATAAEITALCDDLKQLMGGKSGELQQRVFENIIAQFAIANMQAGHNPYEVARLIYHNAKKAIRQNLADQDIIEKMPKGARPN